MNNPAKYQEYLVKQRQRSANNRKEIKSISKMTNPSPEEMAKLSSYREGSKIRKRECRKRKRELTDEKTGPPVKRRLIKTRNEIKEKREKWRVAKAKYRSKLSSQKKRWIKKRIGKEKKKNGPQKQGRN